MQMDGTRRERRAAKLAGLLGAVALGLVAAAPAAQARNEFENGFEDQMGRLFAVETFRLGSFILGSALHGGHVVYSAPTRHYTEHRRYAPPRRHWRGARWHARRHHRRHTHHDDCGHGWGGRRDRWDD